MKSRSLLFFLALAVATTTGFAQAGKAKETVLIGRVTDMKCYLNGMAESMPEHKQCAVDCIKGGLPVGLVEDKTAKVYVVVPEKGMKGANEELVKFADEKVKLTGSMKEKGGTKVFFYSKVEEAK
jgi:hypothetical protein